MKDPEGFSKAIDTLFDQFKERLAPVRVEFLDGKVVMSTQVEMRAGTLFEPKYHQCGYGELPNFITDKIAMLRTAGKGIEVDGMGKWRDNNLYYVQLSPKQWNEQYGSAV